jgi:eukaryotic-like serine/threonine-protein kinase
VGVERASGEVIAGRYRLDRVLGQGGMGQVWCATHTVTRRRVALKFLRGAVDPAATRRFLREARAASAVEHPNVVTIHDVFALEDGTPLMVMDLLLGETLGDRLRRDQSLSPSEAARLMLPVVSAVGTAHELGIVHRDLKPDNVFLTADGDVKVLDFGIAKLGGSGELTETQTADGVVIGTPCYMAPEQGFGERDIDHRADIWALGAMLYEVLSGGRPVEGENIGQIVKRLLEDRITPIEALVPDLPDDVAGMIGRMLERKREDRPRDLREVAAALSKHADVDVPSFGGWRSRELPPLDDRVVDGAHALPASGGTRRAATVGVLLVAALIAGAVALSLLPAKPQPSAAPDESDTPLSVSEPEPKAAALTVAAEPSPTAEPMTTAAPRRAPARKPEPQKLEPPPPSTSAVAPPAPAKTNKSGGLVEEPPF